VLKNVNNLDEKTPAVKTEDAFEWVTCTSLQSLMIFLVYAFYFSLFDLQDYNLYTQGASFGIPSDTRAQDNYHANAYYEAVASSDTLNY